MANIPIKPIKVLTDLTSKKLTKAESGLIVSGTINQENPCAPGTKVGLKVQEGAYIEKDLYVADKTYAVGFSQVGVLDVNGLLHVSGHLVTTGSFELSSSSNFLSINNKAPRNSEGLYFVDDAIHALDERSYLFSTTFNANKVRFDSGPTQDGLQEHTSNFPWSVAGFVSIDVMVYNPSDDSWSNDLISVKLAKNTLNNTIKFLVTTPKTGEAHPDTIIRVIATRQTDIL